MDQERVKFWHDAVYDAAEFGLNEVKKTAKLNRLQETEARTLFRQYLCDTLEDRMMDFDGVSESTAEKMYEEIYSKLIFGAIAGIWGSREQMELTQFVFECANGVADEPTFARILGKIVGSAISLKQANMYMDAADQELNRLSEPDAGEDLSQISCEDMEYWAGTEDFYSGKEQDVMARIMDVAIQSLRELNALHERVKMHTDVQPANMRLYRDGSVKLEGAGTYAGGGCTPEYAAPEKMSGTRGIAADPYLGSASDLYSWALSVLHLLLGERLWQYGPDVACRGMAGGDMLEALMQNSRVPVVIMLQQILRDYLQEDPDKRPHTLRDERVLDLMLTKVYRGALHIDYTPGEALRDFLDEVD